MSTCVVVPEILFLLCLSFLQHARAGTHPIPFPIAQQELRDFTEEEKHINAELMQELEDQVSHLKEEVQEKTESAASLQQELDELTHTSQKLVSGLEKELLSRGEQVAELRDELSKSITEAALQSFLSEENVKGMEVWDFFLFFS